MKPPYENINRIFLTVFFAPLDTSSAMIAKALKFEVADRFQAIERDLASFAGVHAHAEDHLKFDIVVSNPPYIPPVDMNDLDPTVSQM